MATFGDHITTALRELGVVGVTATPATALTTLSLAIINRILDEWNAERGAIYAEAHPALVALTAGTNPHTIGPSGATITAATHRPVMIDGIRLTTDNGETFLAPLTERDAAWWHAQPSPGTTSDYPTSFYYDRTWPNGSIYFHPEPASASVKAEIRYRVVLAQVASGDTFTMPPGYLSALLETLKERLVTLPMFASAATPAIAAMAREARARAFDQNTRIPTVTTDCGLGGGGGGEYDPALGPFSLMGR